MNKEVHSMSQKIELIKNKTTNFTIVLSDKASPSQKYAASELSRYIEESTGVKINIANLIEDLPKKSIILGDHPYITKNYPQIDFENLENEGYYFKFTEHRIIIAGSKIRGTLYGVYSFLEEFLNIRFYDPEYTIIPANEDIILPEISEERTPSLKYRIVTYLNLLDPEFTPTQKCNMNPFAEEELGGCYLLSTAHLTHTFYQLVNPKKYFKTHPEYFALVNGERISNMGQLCLSNPEVIKIATESVLRWFKEDPRVMSMGVIQNDVNNYCECAECKKLEQKYGGVHSAPIVNLCNQIGERLANEYPDQEKYIHTIAYTYSLEPPEDLEIHPRVIIVACDMYPDCADDKPIGTDSRTKKYLEYVREWARLADHMMIWHYAVDFVHPLLPFPNFKSLYENAKIYQEIGIEGILYQATTQLGVYGEFEEFRNWFCYKVLWNTNVEYRELVKDFIYGYYGTAADLIYEYFNNLQKLAKPKEVRMHLYSGLEAGYLKKPFVLNYQKKIEGVMKKLETEIDNNTEKVTEQTRLVLDHVEKVLFSLDYTYLIFPVEYEVALGKIKPKDFNYRKKVLKRFQSCVKKYRVGVLSENVGAKAFLERQKLICGENSILAIAELAPTIMGILNSLLKKVMNNLDDKQGFRPNDYITSALKAGFHPLELNSWMNEKQLVSWTRDADIWTRKLNEERVKSYVNPEIPHTTRKQLPSAVFGMIKGVPNQTEKFE
ncbi:MAG: DUF4838 domain-containing protein [Candidatus Lokiarchaeota archaeon]|nr:DUF4838 domain-containing protein [Candidatus Lokiarchaeota archaeon]